MKLTDRLRIPRGLGYINMLFFILMQGAPGIAYNKMLFPLMGCLTMAYLLMNNHLFKRYKDIWWYIGANIIIFFFQWVTLSWVSVPGAINFSCKIIWGGFLFITLGYQFKYVYLRVMFHLAIIALIFWGIAQVTGECYSIFDTGGGMKYYSLILYCSREGEIERNCGCFWEPGAYACYLMMIGVFFANELPKLWREHKVECVVLVAALLSTRSTTGWLTFGVFIMMFFVLKMRSWVKYLIIPAAAIGALTVYETTDFLKEKVDAQTENSLEAGGEFNSNRLGSLLFDWHYIQKHPFFGNGLHEKTRYADHPGLAKALKRGEYALSGNGLSGHCACMGLAFYAALVYLLFRRNKELSANDRLMILVTFAMLLCGEQLFNYPLALTLCLHVWTNKPSVVKSPPPRAS